MCALIELDNRSTNNPCACMITVKKPTSFVAPTRGSAHALTLSTYVTDAADLHYAVVLAGHAPLSASAIKNAAEQCTADASAESVLTEALGSQFAASTLQQQQQQHRHGSPPPSSPHTDTSSSIAVVTASTVRVAKAQKVERRVDRLLSNTSYDVYFVAEVSGSNGVFGPVQSVLRSATHPEPPTLEVTSVRAANDSATRVEVDASMSAPGRIYFAFVPSNSESSVSSTQLTSLDLVTNRSLSELPSVFALYDTDVWTDLAFRKSVDGLTSATLYDVLVVAEAVGDGAVRSDVVRLANAVRTHALPPNVTRVTSAPMDASADTLVVDCDLRFDAHDVLRASAENLAFFSFNVHYEATRVSGATSAAPTTLKVDDGTLSVTAGSAAPATADASDSDVVVRGVFPFGNFSSVEHFHEQIALPQRGVIRDLQNGTSYRVTLRVETASSHGLVGREAAAALSTTHERAPPILSATATAVNGSVHALAVTAELPRGANVHYLVAPRATAATVRHHFRDATSMAHLTDLVRRDEAEFVFGTIAFDPVDTTASGDSTYTAAFQVDGLRDATAYSIVVMPETHASGGVFGKPFEHLLEAQTNENASDVVLQSAAPVDSSTTSIELVVEMTKPNDVLYYCVATDLALLRPAIETCAEANRTEFQLRPRSAASMHSVVAFTVANLTADMQYYVSVFAENALRNGVLSAATAPPLAVTTHKPAPALVRVEAEPVAASTDRITVSATSAEPCLVHYGLIEAPPATDIGAPSSSDGAESPANDTIAMLLPTPEAIIKDRWVMLGSPTLPASQRQVAFVSQGRAFAHNGVATFGASKLKPNTTYTVFVTTETSRSGNASGVYGAVQAVGVTTFALAPKILRAVVDPTPDRTDSVVITANLSAPGVVHYYLSDVDFADPTIIRAQDDRSSSGDATDRRVATAPHVLRGTFEVHAHDIAMEIINGTNESRPVEPRMFVNNATVRGLASGAMYHVSLTTETHASRGVFGDFPPPILVTTHLRAPVIDASVLSIGPVPGSSGALAIELALSRFGDVHYAVFFRELVRDHSDAIFDERRREQEAQAQAEPEEEPLAAAEANATNATEAPHVWPPVHSTYDLALLNASALKAARFDDLGPGVWDNGTITVSRDDVFTGKRSVKEIKGLPPNAVFDVCLVTETAGSDGIFDWVDSAHACQRVKTHADYSNQSMLFDEIAVVPVDAQTGSVHIALRMSKLPDAPAQVFPALASGISSEDSDGDAVVLERFALAAGRTPFFILADGNDARRDFASNAFSAVSSTSSYDRKLDRPAIGFKHAVPGAHGVVAAGMLRTVEAENATFLTLSHTVDGLAPDHPYYLFVAYETSGSDGVFARVNAHKHQSNDSKAQNDALEVVTHAAAPALTKFSTRPTFGNTSRVTVAMDITCASCREAIVHALVYPAACARPSIDALERFPTDSDSEPETDLHDGNTSSDGLDTSAFVASGSHCDAPLTKRRFVIDMDDRGHKALGVEREIYDARLRPNTTYSVFLATETVNSSGVVSDVFVATTVTTFATAPAFRSIHVTPRKGSTTELLLEFELERPGEVHFLGGVSGNPELNVTSPYNVSRKSRPEKHAPRRHDYGRDVVRMQRSVKAPRGGEKHVVVLDYLTAGTSYDVYVVAEDPESNGIYGRVLEFPGVSTHANAPILLAHTAYATPGSKDSLTVGCRVDAPGAVHISVVQLEYWPQTAHVARGSDVYSNRLAVSEHLVAQASVVVTPDALANGDSWREVNITVPHAGTNYTVYLVTETAMSDGVFGTVASHRDVRSHGEPPTALKLSVTPADARVDALAAKVELTEPGHVHYVVLPHRQRRSGGQGTAVAEGVVDVVANDSRASESGEGGGARRFETAFVIAPLSEGTVFDLYFRCETLHSHGVFGSWTHFPISARTHGLPPDVLEELECAVSPACDAIGREQVRVMPMMMMLMMSDAACSRADVCCSGAAVFANAKRLRRLPRGLCRRARVVERAVSARRRRRPHAQEGTDDQDQRRARQSARVARDGAAGAAARRRGACIAAARGGTSVRVCICVS